ncbi:MAG: hypothetical protein V4543_17985 [Bacteroidota bacterium]
MKTTIRTICIAAGSILLLVCPVFAQSSIPGYFYKSWVLDQAYVMVPKAIIKIPSGKAVTEKAPLNSYQQIDLKADTIRVDNNPDVTASMHKMSLKFTADNSGGDPYCEATLSGGTKYGRCALSIDRKKLYMLNGTGKAGDDPYFDVVYLSPNSLILRRPPAKQQSTKSVGGAAAKLIPDNIEYRFVPAL